MEVFDIAQWRMETIIFGVLAIVLFLLTVSTFLLGETLEFLEDLDGIDDGGLPSFINTQMVLSGLAVFNVTGWVSGAAFDYSLWPSLGLGVIVGGVVGGLMGFLWSAMKKSQATSSVTTFSLVGKEAAVVVPIPADGLGSIEVFDGTRALRFPARCGKPVNDGEIVTIVLFDGTVARVIVKGD
tara:strand:+ start:465 stop:1013 length:549 start_codon:yes stop_codon:yes gene_type:complete